METSQAIEALSALAHGSRLAAFKVLVQAGPPGLARSRQEGRFVIYSADFGNMNGLVGYLTENCCCDAGVCMPAKLTTKGKSHETLPRARRRA